MLYHIKYAFFVCLLYLINGTNTYSQNRYELDTRDIAAPVYKILNLGGESINGEKIVVNNYFIARDNKPIIPITGEFHFSRYPKQYWEESIKKMKAGGITVIATYVFWIMHEEKEGTFDWNGDKNLKQFIELCKKHDMEVIVRIGPFCHGEIRNGGLPDWLLGRPLSIRSNDPLYLSYVERFYNEIGKQLKGLYYKDGGAIIGIQIENEYQHSAAPWGLTYTGQPFDMTAAERDKKLTQEGVGISREVNPYADLGNDHMKILKSLAVASGMQVPLYTATGWGNAAIIPLESIPVTAAYAYPFWTPRRDYSPFFLYKNMRLQPDYAPVRYNPEDYPVFAAELGSGIMSIYKRRPIAVHKSLDAMINRCLGSGANGIGYYMYHGGSTPKGEGYYYNDEAYGLPKISYDFQAPIGEYGQVREGFHRLKLLHFFLQDFGDILAPMQTVLPENAAQIKPTNITDFRYATRSNGYSGFVFLNNFQDDTTMVAQKNIQLKIKTKQGDINIPETGGFNLPSNENVILPYNLDMSGIPLKYATAQLLAKGTSDGEPFYIFFTPESIQGEFSFTGNTKIKNLKGASIQHNSQRALVKCKEKVNEFKVSNGGHSIRILVIDKETALMSYQVSINGEPHFVFSEGIVLENEKGLEVLNTGSPDFTMSIYPKLKTALINEFGKLKLYKKDKVFTSYSISLPTQEIPLEITEINSRKWQVSLPEGLPEFVNDAYLTVNYCGDTAMAFIEGELVSDEFYKGIPWQIGLRKFLNAKSQNMVFYFRPMPKNASYLIDLEPYPNSIPDFGDKKDYLKVNSFTSQIQYKTLITF